MCKIKIKILAQILKRSQIFEIFFVSEKTITKPGVIRHVVNAGGGGPPGQSNWNQQKM